MLNSHVKILGDVKVYEGLFLCWRLQLGDRLLSVIQADGISRGQLLVRCISRQFCWRNMWNDVFKLCLWTKTHVTSSSDQDQERPAYMFVSSDLRQQRNSQFNTVSAVVPISTHATYLWDGNFFNLFCLSLLNSTEITEMFISFWYVPKVSFIFETFWFKVFPKKISLTFQIVFHANNWKKISSYEPLPTHNRIDLLDFHDFFCLLIVWLCFVSFFSLRRTLCEPFHLDEFRLLETCSQMASAQGQWIPQGLQERRPFFWLSRWSHIWASLAFLHGLHVVHHGNLARLQFEFKLLDILGYC